MICDISISFHAGSVIEIDKVAYELLPWWVLHQVPQGIFDLPLLSADSHTMLEVKLILSGVTIAALQALLFKAIYHKKIWMFDAWNLPK